MKTNALYTNKDKLYYPKRFISTKNKIIISYKETSIIGVIFFSFY